MAPILKDKHTLMTAHSLRFPQQELRAYRLFELHGEVSQAWCREKRLPLIEDHQDAALGPLKGKREVSHYRSWRLPAMTRRWSARSLACSNVSSSQANGLSPACDASRFIGQRRRRAVGFLGPL